MGADSRFHHAYVAWGSEHLNRVKVLAGGVRYVVSGFDQLAIVSEDFESFASPWFKPETGQFVIDVGANIGKYALLASRLVGESGKVIALEPNPRTYSMLAENIALNNARNVIALNLAAWNQHSQLKLYRAKESIGSSAKWDYQLGFDIVNARPLSSIMQELGVDHADWVKIDAEGAEREVLEGMQEFLFRCRRFIIEVNRRNIFWVKEFAKQMGLLLVRISNEDINGMTYYSAMRENQS